MYINLILHIVCYLYQYLHIYQSIFHVGPPINWPSPPVAVSHPAAPPHVEESVAGSTMV